MNTNSKIDVAALDALHRRALEEVIGQELTGRQALIISIVDAGAEASPRRPSQSLADWTRIYDGLGDSEIDAIDQLVNTRTGLHRDLS